MSTKVGDIFVRANLDRSEYNKGLGMMSKEAQKIGASIGRKLGFGLGVAGLGAFIKKATDAGASLNAMGTIIDASLPHMTEQVDNFAKSAGAMFGLSETQAKGFVGKFASMSSAMGYTEKQAYNMSTALTGLAGDVASYYHISQDDAFAKLGAVFTGETESLKQLGVVMTQNALDQFALQQGFGKTTAQMTELEKTTLRYQFVMDRLKLTAGDFAKYANTWSGSIATIKLNWSNFMATVGQGIINILLPLLQMIAKVSNALTALASRFLGWTQKLRGIKAPLNNAFGKKTQQDLANTGTGIGNVGSGLGGVGSSAKGAKKQVQALKKELMGFDRITKLTGEQGVTTGGTGTSGGGGGISAGGVDFSEAESDISTFSEKAKNLLAGIKLPPALTTALNDLKDAFSNLFGVLKDAGKWAWDNVLVPLGKWTLNTLAPTGVEALSKAVNLVANALKFLGELLKPLWEPLIKPVFSYLGGVAVSGIKALGDIMGVFAKVLGTATEGLKKLKEMAKPTIDGIKKKWEAFKKSIGKGGKFKIKISFTDLKKSFYDKLKTIKEKWRSFKSVVQNRTITTTLKVVGQSLLDKVKNAWDAIKDKTSTLKIQFIDSMKSVWNGLASKVNAARAKSKLAQTLIPSDMPYLATGGYVKANTPQLAVIGDNKREGEIVAPESRLRAMAEEVQNGGNAEMIRLLTQLLVAVQNIDTTVYLDGEAIKNNTVRRINNHTRQTGRLELVI